MKHKTSITTACSGSPINLAPTEARRYTRRIFMKRQCYMKTVRILLLTICMISFWSCAHRTPTLQQSILDDPSVDQRYKDAMRQKRIVPGMTHNMVEATLGPAHFINYSSFDDGSQAEVWVYKPSLAK
jgi:hypothetical protein